MVLIRHWQIENKMDLVSSHLELTNYKCREEKSLSFRNEYVLGLNGPRGHLWGGAGTIQGELWEKSSTQREFQVWLELRKERMLYEIRLVKQAETRSSRSMQSNEKPLKDLERDGISLYLHYWVIHLFCWWEWIATEQKWKQTNRKHNNFEVTVDKVQWWNDVGSDGELKVKKNVLLLGLRNWVNGGTIYQGRKAYQKKRKNSWNVGECKIKHFIWNILILRAWDKAKWRCQIKRL